MRTFRPKHNPEPVAPAHRLQSFLARRGYTWAFIDSLTFKRLCQLARRSGYFGSAYATAKPMTGLAHHRQL